MPDAALVIRYEIAHRGAEGTLSEPTTFTVSLDPRSLLNVEPLPDPAPPWAALGFEKCPNCPLKDTLCPAAARLENVVTRFADVFSYERVWARVSVKERVYLQEDVPVQQALSSLLGVYMSTSGCPVVGKLRPLVRFHLPFATELETISRTASMYLLRQYLLAQRGETPDWELSQLADDLRETTVVNRAFARRLRAAAPKDANVNALIRLDSAARTLPEIIADQLEELQFLFAN